jgi:hypothetical protein
METDKLAAPTAPKPLPTPTPLPKAFDLGIPGGTYMATPTYVFVDKAGQWFATSMSNANVPAGQFGIHVWYRKSMTAPWELLRFKDGCHGNLTLLQGKLYFIVNTKSGAVIAEQIERYQGAV